MGEQKRNRRRRSLRETGRRPKSEKHGRRPSRLREALATVGGKAHPRTPDDAWLADLVTGLEAEPWDVLTHGFHAYPARMHPVLARRILSRFAVPGQVVLDPFVGGGTVLVEAMVRGCQAEGSDVNPMAVRIAWARTRLWSPGRIRSFVDLGAKIAGSAFEDARQRVSRPLTAGARRYRDWFAPHVLQELMGIDARIRSVEDQAFRKLAELILSSILIKVSRRRADTVVASSEKHIGRGTPSRLFGRKASEFGERLRRLADAVPAGTPVPRIRLEDARTLESAGDRVDIVITSPPYVGTYDYARYQALRLDWLGVSTAFMAAHEIGARSDPGRGRHWRRDEARVVRELARVLRPGGHAFLVVGDGVLDGKPYRADASMTAAATRAGLEVLGVASQERPHVNARVERVYRGGPRYEHLIALKKQETT